MVIAIGVFFVGMFLLGAAVVLAMEPTRIDIGIPNNPNLACPELCVQFEARRLERCNAQSRERGLLAIVRFFTALFVAATIAAAIATALAIALGSNPLTVVMGAIAGVVAVALAGNAALYAGMLAAYTYLLMLAVGETRTALGRENEAIARVGRAAARTRPLHASRGRHRASPNPKRELADRSCGRLVVRLAGP